MARVWFVLLGPIVALACGSGEQKPALSPTPAASAPISLLMYTISGTVHDDVGKPVADASVAAGAPFLTASKAVPGFFTKTDAAGQYQGRLAKGTYTLFVNKPGFDSFSRADISLSADIVIDVTLRPGVIVAGKVIEAGVGPLDDATVEVTSGTNAGRRTLTGHPIPGQYFLDHILPGDFTLRVSKAGYDSVQQNVHAVDTTTVDFSIKWAYGTCLRSVGPVLFDFYPSGGGTETVTVAANAGRSWTATPDVPWVELISPSRQAGAAQINFRVQPNPSGAIERRRGAVMIRCSVSEGQNVWISQMPDCAVRLQAEPDTPSTFGSAGGIGHLLLQVGTPGCRWEARSDVDWMHTAGISSWSGDPPTAIAFVVMRNSTGSDRTGHIVVGETRWEVKQAR